MTKFKGQGNEWSSIPMIKAINLLVKQDREKNVREANALFKINMIKKIAKQDAEIEALRLNLFPQK